MTDRMDAVDHTHPVGNAVAGAYRRGRNANDGLMTDGSGEEDDPDPDVETDADGARMRDVSHTPPDGDGTNDVWARGDAPVREDDE